METEHDYNQQQYEEADKQMHLDKQHELFFGGLLFIGILLVIAWVLWEIFSL